MPVLPLPIGGAPLGGGALPVSSAADVAAVEDNLIRLPATADVRDAIRAGEEAAFEAYQIRSEVAAAQGDPTRATGAMLQGHASDRGIYKQDIETDAQLQSRLSGSTAVVTPNDICAIANAVLAPYTSKTVRYFESILDRGYVTDGSTNTNSFIGAPPRYLDRLYPDQAGVEGPYVIPSLEVWGFWSFADSGGRYFILRVPSLQALGDQSNFVGDSTGTLQLDASNDGFWVQDGTGSSVCSFVADGGTALDVYQRLVNEVDAAVGHSVRWQMISDDNL